MFARFSLQERWRFAVCAALAAFVFSSRAWLIRTGGSPVPFWDQWDAEVTNLYSPWLHGNLRWSDLWQPHNEHRILFTRLFDLLLLEVLGTWNPWAQMILGAVLHAASAAALAAVFWPATLLKSRGSLIVGLALLFSATCGWQNATWGFQFQVYLADIFSIMAFAGLCLAPALSRKWWLGLGFAVLALFTNGGGILALAAVVPIGFFFTPRDKHRWVSCGLLLGVLALASRMNHEVAQHIPLRAHSVSQFFAVFTRCLAWPWVDFGALAVIMQLPLAALLFRQWRRGEPLDPAERFALALGFLGLLQAAAIAYSRGGGLLEARPLSRYQDPLLLGTAAQLFAAVRLWSSPSRLMRVSLLIGGGIAVAGLIALTETNLTLHLPYKRAQDRASLAVLRSYATGDKPAFVRDKNEFGRHPNPLAIQGAFDDPALRAILPADLLVSPDSPPPIPPWVVRQGPALTAGSAILLLFLIFSACKRESPANVVDPKIA